MAWATALERRKAPTALVLTRQKLEPVPVAEPLTAEAFGRGAYVVTREKGAKPDLVLVGTGSEVGVAVAAAKLLQPSLSVRVVSMPWRERFASLPAAEREAIVPAGAKVVVVEAGIQQGWGDVFRQPLLFCGMNHFGLRRRPKSWRPSSGSPARKWPSAFAPGCPGRERADQRSDMAAEPTAASNNGGLEIRTDGALDFLSLGALVHRLDPGLVPFRKATHCDIHVSGGEYNVAANLADAFGLRAAVASAMVDYPIGDLIANRVRAMGVTGFYKRFPHNGVSGPNMAAVYSDRGFGLVRRWCSTTGPMKRRPSSAPGDFDWAKIFGAACAGSTRAASSPRSRRRRAS